MQKSYQRFEPFERYTAIMDAAVEVAREVGYMSVTREAVAERAGVSPGLISRYMGSVGELQHRVVAYAVRNDLVDLVTQAAIHDHPLVQETLISPELARKVHAFIDTKLQA